MAIEKLRGPIALEDALLKEINKKAKVLKMTRAELIRNALMEYLFRFDELMDVKLLAHAIEADESKRPLEEIAKALKLN
jgi:metal-responsive CopG/Arc/MetJ family transcriptional regulator